MISVAVIGRGYVGKATIKLLQKAYSVYSWDIQDGWL